MRDIKFRAWDELKKFMLDGDDLEEAPSNELFSGLSYGKLTIASTLADWRELEIMQYTGLKDKNGVEIYEGDILETPYEYAGNSYLDECGSSGKYRGLVHYRPSKGFIQMRVMQMDDEVDCWSKRGDLEIRQSYTTVIGNIHEDKELLNNDS